MTARRITESVDQQTINLEPDVALNQINGEIWGGDGERTLEEREALISKFYLGRTALRGACQPRSLNISLANI